MNLVLYAVPLFVLALAIELAWGHFRGANTYRLADTINSLQMGTMSRLRGVLQIGIGGAVYGALTNEFTLFEMGTADPLVWALAFVAYDFCYYWSHRMGHEWRLLWAAHVAHHQSEEYNLSTALRQTSTSYLNFVFYVPLYVLGFPPYVIVTVGSLNLIYQFWVHTEHIRTLGPLEWVLITPSNHRVHHAKNPEYLDRNYGGVFILWDRLFRTFKAEEPDRPCVYGTTEQLASWNPLWANLHVYVGGVKDMVGTRYPSDALRLWFKGPGWRPRDLRDAPPHDWQVAKYNPRASTFARAYTFAQFWVAVPLSFVVLFSEMSREMVLAAAALLAYGFYVQGAWLEGRQYARLLEWLRLAGTLLLAWYGAAISLSWNVEVAYWLTGYAAASATCLLWAVLTGRDSLAASPGEMPAHSKPPEAAAS